MTNSKPILIAAAIILPLICVGILLVGVVGGLIFVASAEDGTIASASAKADSEQIELEILAIAADYANDKDLSTARTRLQTLTLPNVEQYVAFMVDRYLQEGRGLNDADTMNLFLLADALGTTTPSMVAALTPPTITPTATLPPTATPLPTDTPTPTEPTATSTPLPVPSEVITQTAEAAAAPAEESTPEPDLPTPTPAPPTDTPEPTATPEPTKPPVDFVVAEAYMIRNPQYNSCPGNHQIFVTVVDAAGNPIDGVTVEDTFQAVPPKLSGEKGPGKLEYDLWNNGFSLHVTKGMDGAPATSEATPKLSSWDEDIPNEWLVEANYCLDLNDCVQRKSSNQLCRGHYSYQVTFKRTY